MSTPEGTDPSESGAAEPTTAEGTDASESGPVLPSVPDGADRSDLGPAVPTESTDREGANAGPAEPTVPDGADPGHAEPNLAQPSGDRSRPINAVRRSDREQDEAWIRSFLATAPFGFLATVAEGRPFLNSNLFVHDPEAHAIYLHTARTGRTPGNVALGGPATFSVASMGRLLPAAEALEFSAEFGGVVIFGTIGPVPDPGEARHALQLILDRYAPHLRPGRDYRPITEGELRRTAVHRLDIEAWSGKQKTAAPDFPGAYHPSTVFGGGLAGASAGDSPTGADPRLSAAHWPGRTPRLHLL